MTNLEYANALRRIAEVYAGNPHLTRPCTSIVVYTHTKKTFTAAVAAFGPGTKVYTNDTLRFQPDLSQPLGFEIVGFKNGICERVLVGTKDVPEKIIPATQEEVIPAYTEEVYEWDCKPFLNGEEGAS